MANCTDANLGLETVPDYDNHIPDLHKRENLQPLWVKISRLFKSQIAFMALQAINYVFQLVE